MKLLLLADLHNRRPWYDWVVAQTPQYDLVVIAGDLLDMFGLDQRGQIEFLRERWLPAMRRTEVPVALCSGNHDAPAAMWLAYLTETEGIVGDGATALLKLPSGERLIVTTCPYNNSFSMDDRQMISLWEQGARLRDRDQVPWLVLHHEPCAPLAEGQLVVAHWLEARVGQYQPDYVASGHFHRGGERNFAYPIGRTWCSNAGQDLEAPRPNYIVLNSTERTATRVRMRPVPQSLSWREERAVIDLI